ncbi:MAG: hypothetical protein ACLFVS_07655 [Candidatus Acetothermia bacterium]
MDRFRNKMMAGEGEIQADVGRIEDLVRQVFQRNLTFPIRLSENVLTSGKLQQFPLTRPAS